MAESRPLTSDLSVDSPPDLKRYRSGGGYTALAKALQMAPKEITKLVTDAKLRGRGGAGFPTGQKWSFVPMGADAPQPKYLVVNADEMEPGTFKDRLLMEGHPHQLIEGVLISAYAIQARHAYIFLRAEYPLAARRLQKAIDEAVAANLLGKRIQGSDFSLDLSIHVSAGRYICGEETALLSALEGKRAIPRAKPPFPQVSGLWGKPTVVNNVETIANVAHIVRHGAEWFKGLSHSADAGTKIYGASGRVARPGAWELPMGTSLRELIEKHAGGMQPGFGLKGILPGGASTDFLTAGQLDVAMDFDSLVKAGSRLGTGTLLVLDDRTCPIGLLISIERFFAQESCGWCTPCRDGLPWVVRLLQKIEGGHGTSADLDQLAMHTHLLGPGHTFCAHAPGAMEPLQSALKHFRDDFERHIREHRCPYAGVQ
jgi:NADH-quinone oxidoreductase subunit F